MVLDITDIEYRFIVLELSAVEYLVCLFVFFFFSLFLLFVFVGMAWIVKLSGLTLANKISYLPMLGICMIFKKFHVWRNVRACIKCSLWIVKKDGQEQHLTCKPNSCYFSLAINACHFLWLDKFLWLARVSSYGREEEEECFYVRQR